MKRHILISVTFAFSLICSCSVTKTSTPSSNIVTGGKLWSALWQQRAAEYKALCFQAYNVAKLRVDEALKQSQTSPLAIITDIDETVLDNSPNAVAQALKGKDFEQDAWYKWTSKAACDTVPGSASFFKYAAAKGISVFYITNRDENERNATLNNLKKYQFPFADNEHLMLKKTTSAKESRRSEVSKSHKIILLIGDNLSDFSQAFDKLQLPEREKITTDNAVLFGDKFIMLPNAGYGDWENSLFRYNYKLNQSQKEQIILDLLKKE